MSKKFGIDNAKNTRNIESIAKTLTISGVFLALFIPSLLIMLVVFMFWAIALVMVAIVGMDIEMRIKLREKLKMGKEGKKEKNSWKDYK